MILRLEDNGLRQRTKPRPGGRVAKFNRGGRREASDMVRVVPGTGQRTFYNPSTGDAVVMELQDGLGKGLFKRMKERRKKRQAYKDKRFEQRQEAKTQRQAQRQERKQVRLVGKTKVAGQKQKARLAKFVAKEQEAQYSPGYDENSDAVPDYSAIPGGEYQTDSQGEDTIDVDFEEVQPGEEEGGEEYEEAGAYDTGFEDNGYPVQLGGWIDTVFQAGKKLLTTKTGQAVQQVAVSQADYKRMQNENAMMKNEIESLKNQNLMYGAGGAVGGALVGVLISKALK